MANIVTFGPFDIGDTETISATFRNAAGAPTSPTAVTLRIRKPDAVGTILTPTPTAGGPGVYSYVLTFDVSGGWEWGWKGTGAVAQAEQGRAYVRRSRVLV